MCVMRIMSHTPDARNVNTNLAYMKWKYPHYPIPTDVKILCEEKYFFKRKLWFMHDHEFADLIWLVFKILSI